LFQPRLVGFNTGNASTHICSHKRAA